MMGDMADWVTENGLMPWDGTGPDPEEEEIDQCEACGKWDKLYPIINAEAEECDAPGVNPNKA